MLKDVSEERWPPDSCGLAQPGPSSTGNPARAMFSDSLPEFGVQQTQVLRYTTTSFIVNCGVIVLMLAVPLMFTESYPRLSC